MVHMAEQGALDGGIAVIQTSSAPIAKLVDGTKPSEDHPMSLKATQVADEYLDAVTREILTSTGEQPIIITAEDAAKKVHRVDASLAHVPMVVLGENFWEGLHNQTKQLWRAPLADLTMSRGFLPALSAKPVGFLPIVGTQPERTPQQFKPHASEVVIADDNASASASTLRKAADIIRTNGGDVKAFIVGFYAGPKRTDDGQFTQLEGRPLIAVKTRFASPSHQRFLLEQGKKRRPSIETVDLGYFPGSGQPMVAGYPEAEATLGQVAIALHDFSTKGGRGDQLRNRIQALGAVVHDEHGLVNFMKNLTEPLGVEHMIQLFSEPTYEGGGSQKFPILSIRGLNFSAVDPRRTPRIWPGTKEMPQSFWDLFTVAAWERFSSRMLSLNIELLQNVREIRGDHVATHELPFLLLPDVQRMISRPTAPAHAIDALRILQRELGVTMTIHT